jgi:hypothetical protein
LKKLETQLDLPRLKSINVMNKILLKKFILIAAGIPLLAGCIVYRDRPVQGEVTGEVTVATPPPPPPPQVEIVPICPGPVDIWFWIPGTWEWRGHWVWIGGRWTPRPHPHAIWIGGGWVRHGHTHVWVRGHWQ